MPATFWYSSVAGAVPRLALLEGIQQLPLPPGHLGDLNGNPLGLVLNAIASHTPILPTTDQPNSDPIPIGCGPFGPALSLPRLILSDGEPVPRTVSASATILDEEASKLTASLDRLDEQAANTALDRLFAAYTVEMVLQDVVLPYLHRLGERWEAGEVSVAQEHLVSNLVRGRLMGLAQGWGQGQGPGAIPRLPAR
jgi:hypothetical protein